MAGKMKSLLDNLYQFIELLALSQSAHAKDWDVLHVQKALEWGSYFQHVHHRFKANKDFRNSIEAHLSVKNLELSSYMKNYHYIRFDDLGKARDLLCMSLLQNKALPDAVFKYVSELVRNADSMGAECIGLSHIISQKVASQLLLSHPLWAANELHEPLDDPIVITQADLLRSSLERRLKMSEDNSKSFIVSDILSPISKPRVYHLIVSILLPNDSLDSEHQGLIHHLLLDWVLSDGDHFDGFFMNVNCQFLARLSFVSTKFRNVYMDHLLKLVGNMEQDTCGKWVSDSFKLSFEGLLDHYKHLVEGPEDVKDSILTKLQTLKIQDGNYDVPGVSIWTDLLVKIHKI